MLVNQKARRQKKWTKTKRIVVVIILLVLVAVACKLIGNSLVPRAKESKSVVHKYQIMGSTSYAVNLIENDFIEYSQMGMNQVYIAKLVKELPVQFYYTYDSDEKENITYTYYVSAKLTAVSNAVASGDSSIIWNKEYTLKAPVTKTVSATKTFNINENTVIDYQLYNSMISDFVKALSIPVDAKLDVSLNVDINGNIKGESLREKTVLTTSIPLNEQIFKVTNTESFNTPYELTKVNISEKEIPKYDLIYGIVLLGLSISVFIIHCKKIIGIPPRTEYEKTIRKIQKEYGDIVIEVNTLENLDDFTIIDVKNFNEMLDLEQELRIPIMMYEETSTGPCWFTIAHNSLLYRCTYNNPETKDVSKVEETEIIDKDDLTPPTKDK